MEHKIQFYAEKLETYNRHIDERVLEDQAMESQIYTLMMLVKDGRADAYSNPVTLKKIMDIGNKALTTFSLLSRSDFVPVMDVGGHIANGYWISDRPITFSNTENGTVKNGYLMHYQDRDDDPLLREIADIDKLALV